MMDKKKKERLEKAGWKSGTVDEFLRLTPEESEIVELKMQLSTALRERRKKLGLSQEDLAQRLRSSQSRIAKMERDNGSVTIDLLVRGLLATGMRLKELARVVSPPNGHPAKVR